MDAPIIPLARLRELLEFSSESGLFVWQVRTNKRIKIGVVAGTINSDCYIVITIYGRLYYAHRLAWFYMTGAWPENQIDHIDGDRANNRFANLREATRSENNQNIRNARSNNLSSGLLGTSWDKHNQKWRAKITLDGKQRHLGRYITAEEAHAAYLGEKRRIHKFSTI